MKKSLGAKTLVYPTPVFVVGTYDAQGKPNVMTASWGGICCSQPPCVAVSLRKETYTHGNIVARQAFTLSIPSEQHVRPADHFGIVSGCQVDKLAAARLPKSISDPGQSTRRDADGVGVPTQVDGLQHRLGEIAAGQHKPPRHVLGIECLALHAAGAVAPRSECLPVPAPLVSGHVGEIDVDSFGCSDAG